MQVVFQTDPNANGVYGLVQNLGKEMDADAAGTACALTIS